MSGLARVLHGNTFFLFTYPPTLNPTVQLFEYARLPIPTNRDQTVKEFFHKRIFFGCLTIVIMTGCGPRLGNVTGKIFVDGKPSPFVRVNFRSEQTEDVYTSSISADYSYFVRMPSGDRGIPVGEYRVWLSVPLGQEGLPETVAVQKALPEALFDEAKSGLVCLVQSSGTVFDINAESK